MTNQIDHFKTVDAEPNKSNTSEIRTSEIYQEKAKSTQ